MRRFLYVRGRRHCIGILAFVIAGCHSPTYVTVTVSGDLVGIQQFRVEATDAVHTSEIYVPSVPHPLTLPQTFTVEVPSSWSGTLTLSLTAFGAGAAIVGHGEANSVSSAVDVSLTSASSAVTDGIGASGGITDIYPNGAHCTSGANCMSGVCAVGVCCNTKCDGACMTCAAPGTVGTCTARFAGAPSDGMCPDQGGCGLDGTCDGRGACRQYVTGTNCGAATCSADGMTAEGGQACDGFGTCRPGLPVACTPFRCRDGACLDTCATAADCASGNGCVAGSCGFKMKGASCTVGDECATGFCVDGNCCNVACTGACVSCSSPGRVGTCWPIDEGNEDPRSVCKVQDPPTCGTNGRCDGKGGCATYPDETECTAPACVGPFYKPASLCRGGVCVAGAALSCFPFMCSGASCFAGCSSNADCASPSVCNNGSCGLRPISASCSEDRECATGFCVMDICCTEACGGACRSCSVPGQLGLCSPLPPGSIDPGMRCQPEAASTCGMTGVCDGAGACGLYGPQTTCASLEDGSAPATCDGEGHCGSIPASVVPDAGAAPDCGAGDDGSSIEAGACQSVSTNKGNDASGGEMLPPARMRQWR